MSSVITIGKIATITKKERVAEAIQTAILSGKLSPGHRIVESQLARDMGVGNTVLREALFELESKGFVRRVANKGTFVTQLTREDVEQIFCARREMEGLAAELAQKRITERDLVSLEQCIEKMRSAALHNRLQDFCLFDIEYHTTIWRLSGNRFLAAALETMVVPLFAFFNMTCPPDNSQTLLESVEQHADVIRAFRTGKKVRSRMEKAIDYFRMEKCKLLFNEGERSAK